MPTTLLAVCTGNICRSPALKLLLEATGDGSTTVTSAGISVPDDLLGRHMAPLMVEALSQKGIDTSTAPTLHSQRLTTEMIQSADLIVTMTAKQRATVVSLVPAAVRRTFTLLELAALLRGTHWPGPLPEHVGRPLNDAVRWASVPALANARRSRIALHLTTLDVPDPWGKKSIRHYRSTLNTIVDANNAISEALGVSTLHDTAEVLGVKSRWGFLRGKSNTTANTTMGTEE